MKKYTVQRPMITWIETEVQAENLAEALETAQDDFDSGNYFELVETWEIDYSRHWVQTHDGLIFTESHAPAEPSKH
jgi:hypothetical protein